jgi:hypothetical protein
MAPCRVCKNEHDQGHLVSGSRFHITMTPGHFENSVVQRTGIFHTFESILLHIIIYAMCVYAQAIPCNIRLQFNKLAGGSVPFRINGQTYNVDVQKDQSMTRLGGAGGTSSLRATLL